MANATPNKVNFGLKNAHAAVYDATAGTYATPFALPGSVSLSLDPRGDMIEFYADDMLYYSASNNQGYDGSLELSLVTQEFRVKVLGEELVATDYVLLEQQAAQGSPYALLFEITGDKYASKNALYNCTASRPSKSANTKTSSTDPQTESFDFVASGRGSDGYVKAVTTADTPSTVMGNWYKSVYLKTVA